MIEAAFCNKFISSNCPNGPTEFLMNMVNRGYLFKNNDQLI